MQFPFIGKIRRPIPWVTGILLVGLLGSTSAAYLIHRRATSTQDITELTVPVSARDLRIRVTASGVVQPIQSVNLSPKTAGRLIKLYVEQGEQVEQGQVVAQMESDELEAQLIQAQGSLAQAQARLDELRAGARPEAIDQAEAIVQVQEALTREAQARLDLAAERLERNRALRAEGAISQDQLDEVLNEQRRAQASLEQAQAQLQDAQKRLEELRRGPRVEEIAQAIAQVKEAQGQVQLIQVQLRDTRIRAPFPGVITQKYAEPGSFVTPTTSASSISSATSTAIVALARDLEVLADVPEVDIGQITPNQPVEIVADAYPDQVFRGHVKLIAPEAVKEENVTSFQVRVALETGQKQLRSGMNVDLTFLGQELSDALVVPTVAIVTQQGQTGVLVPDSDDEPQFRAVVLGASLGNQTQILQGVELGEQVFIDLPKDQKLEEILDPEAAS